MLKKFRDGLLREEPQDSEHIILSRDTRLGSRCN
jgi:hypothetical protein